MSVRRCYYSLSERKTSTIIPCAVEVRSLCERDGKPNEKRNAARMRLINLSSICPWNLHFVSFSPLLSSSFVFTVRTLFDTFYRRFAQRRSWFTSIIYLIYLFTFIKMQRVPSLFAITVLRHLVKWDRELKRREKPERNKKKYEKWRRGVKLR